MIDVNRKLDIKGLVEKGTVFLFGSRQTGKSTYIRHEILPMAQKMYSLLVIDEVQKCPEVPDVVHELIEERRIRFLLTGSSARALKRSGVNLLSGRGRERTLHPFIYRELKDLGFDLKKAINHGLIPNHYAAEDADDLLQSYVSRFLEAAAVCNSQQLDYSSLASDAGVARQTVQNYFQILKDTFLGYERAAWTRSLKRKAMVTPKFSFLILASSRLCDTLETFPKLAQTLVTFLSTFFLGNTPKD